MCADVFSGSAWPERLGECTWYLPWRFHRSATGIGGWHLLHKVALETWSCLFTFNQGTDSWEIKKYHTKTGEDGETWGVSHCYGAAVRRRIIKVEPEIPTGEAIHYIPHQPVIRDQAKSTKIRIVYYCSAKANSRVSLNDCLEVGPLCSLWFLTFCNEIVRGWSVLPGTSKRLFFKLKWTQRIEMPFVSYGTRPLTQGQLQSIDTPEWFSGQDLVLTFSGWHYVSQYTKKFPDTTDELLNNTYVDDVQLGGNHSNQSIKLKKRPQRLWWKEVFISTNGRVTYQSWKNVRKLKMMQCFLKQVRLMPS